MDFIYLIILFLITFIILFNIYILYNYCNLFFIEKFNNNNCNDFIKHQNTYCYPGVKGTLIEKNQLKLQCKSKDKCKGYIVYNKGDNINKGYLCRDNWSGTLNNYDKTDTYECQMKCECPDGYTQIKCDTKSGVAICEAPVDVETDNKIQEINNKIITLEGDIKNNKKDNIKLIQNLENKQVKNIIYKKKYIERGIHYAESYRSNYNSNDTFKLKLGESSQKICHQLNRIVMNGFHQNFDIKIDNIEYRVISYDDNDNHNKKIYRLNENLKNINSINLNLMETEKLTVDIDSLTTYILNIDGNNIKYKYIYIKYSRVSLQRYSYFGPDIGDVKIKIGFYYDNGEWYFKIEEYILNNIYTQTQINYQNTKFSALNIEQKNEFNILQPFIKYNNYNVNLLNDNYKNNNLIFIKHNSKEDDIWYYIPRINYNKTLTVCNSYNSDPYSAKISNTYFYIPIKNSNGSFNILEYYKLPKEHKYENSNIYIKQNNKELKDGTEILFLNIAHIYSFDLILKFCNKKLIVSGIPNNAIIELILESK